MLITNHQRGIIRLLKGKLELRPGENTVADDLWKQVEGNRHVVQLRAMKNLTVAAGGTQDKSLPLPEPEPLAAQSEPEQVEVETTVEESPSTKDMSAKDAIEQIKEANDEEWLKLCLDTETRSTVIDALNGRLEELEVAI